MILLSTPLFSHWSIPLKREERWEKGEGIRTEE
jgi:hypothetical protein